MTVRVEELAQQIASLKESDFQALFDRVQELSCRHGIRAMSDRYRQRLAEMGEVNNSADIILFKLKQIREEIASREYPG